jgi:branched-chain amino acid transport system permease protein
MMREPLERLSRDYRILIVIGIALAIFPIFFNAINIQTSLAVQILYWAYLGTAWNIMGGYAGQFSFGHAAFFGIGAYTSTVLLVDYGITPWLGMLVGAGLAGLFGLAVGFLSFQFGLKGAIFALATFAFAEMLRLYSTELELVNTSIGIHIPLVRGDSWSRLQFEDTQLYYYYVMLGILLIGLVITIQIVNNKLGYYLQSVREDEDAAAALGVDVLRYKVIATVISAAMTAIGGSFFAQFFLFIDPTLAFGVLVSVDILMRPIVGGTGTIWGPLAGSFLLTPLAEFSRRFVRNPPDFLNYIEGRAGVDRMLFGLLLIIFILYLPDGIVGSVPRLWQRLRGRLTWLSSR